MEEESKPEGETQEEKPEEKSEEEKPEGEESPAGDKKETLIENAIKAAERLEKANKDMEKNLKKMEELTVESALAGRAVLGGKKPQLTPEQYAEEVREGRINPLAV